MSLARASTAALEAHQFLCHEIVNTTTLQHKLYAQAMTSANIAAAGLPNDPELNMIRADLHVATGNTSFAVLLVQKTVETWFDRYEGDMFDSSYPDYLTDPTWAMGALSMAIRVARRNGNATLASHWFWKSKRLSWLFRWKHPTQIPPNLYWKPEPVHVAKKWFNASDFDVNPTSAWVRQFIGMKPIVTKEVNALLKHVPPSTWSFLRSHRPDHCGEPLGSKEIHLWQRGQWNEQVCRFLPNVCRFLRRHAAIVGTNKGVGLLSQISVLYIVPGLHRGPMFDNKGESVVVHVGVDTVHSVGSRLTIRVANTTKECSSSGDEAVQAYDSSFEHEIWNKGDAPWVGLHIPFFHPRYADFLALVAEE
jgi:hypothetical protein